MKMTVINVMIFNKLNLKVLPTDTIKHSPLFINACSFHLVVFVTNQVSEHLINFQTFFILALFGRFYSFLYI